MSNEYLRGLNDARRALAADRDALAIDGHTISRKERLIAFYALTQGMTKIDALIAGVEALPEVGLPDDQYVLGIHMPVPPVVGSGTGSGGVGGSGGGGPQRIRTKVQCPVCVGSGRLVNGNRCPKCLGEGMIFEECS
jgi:hypothetical protein